MYPKLLNSSIYYKNKTKQFWTSNQNSNLQTRLFLHVYFYNVYSILLEEFSL